jgi:Zn-dependent M16 (insulinase) family peptidase
MPELNTANKFWYVVKKVLTSPLSLAIWAVGGVLIASEITWWLPFLLALVAQAVLIASRLHNEEYLRKLFLDRQQREETLTEQQVEAMLEKMDFETRQRIRYILQLQKEMMREARADDVEGYARQELDRIAGHLAPLVQRAVGIAIRKQQLTKYLTNVDERALKSYCNNLRQRIATTTDPVARAQYEQALQRREAELQTYQSIAQFAARIDSQLENIEATFASSKAKVIRIKTADAASATAVSQGLYQELDALNSEIDLLDTSVTEALSSEEELSLKQKSGT